MCNVVDPNELEILHQEYQRNSGQMYNFVMFGERVLTIAIPAAAAAAYFGLQNKKIWLFLPVLTFGSGFYLLYILHEIAALAGYIKHLEARINHISNKEVLYFQKRIGTYMANSLPATVLFIFATVLLLGSLGFYFIAVFQEISNATLKIIAAIMPIGFLFLYFLIIIKISKVAHIIENKMNT